MAGNYKNYMKLLNSWPVDHGKTNKDLGLYIRKRVKNAFSNPVQRNRLEQEECDRYYASLQRLSSNYHKNLYQRVLFSSATGLNDQQCNQILSSNFRSYWIKQNKRFIFKLKYSFQYYYRKIFHE